ncbi:MAG: acyltransferase [Deltaproteobacteria bacterium]|nr:acyltransferase [Deltaproteobacteria bacterium]
MPQIPLLDSRPFHRRLFSAGIAILIAVFLFSTLIAINLTQTASLLLWIFSKKAFRVYNRFAANTWWGLCDITAKWIHGAHLELTGDPIPKKENVIVVSNHQQSPDITFFFMLAKAKGRLGDLKWFVKDTIKYVPGIGWGMLFIGCIFVKRNWTRDRASIEKTFAWINKGAVPFWIILFVEGTRLTPAKLAKSHQYAESRNEQPLRHLLLPRTKGFTSAVIGLRDGHLDAVYDLTIGYTDGVPTLSQYVAGVSKVAHFHVRRYVAADLPETEEALSEWLMERFREKDRRLDAFYREGAFS